MLYPARVPAAAPDVLIVGGGVIGLTCAFRLAEAGAEVVVVDASGASGASWAAAGMLAPVSEAGFGEEDLVRLNVAAVADFRRLAVTLDQLPGESVGLRTEGTLAVAFNGDDKAALARMTDYRSSLGLQSQTLTGSATRTLEPFLAANIRGGVLAQDDLSVDNRRYVQSLQRAGAARGVATVTGTVATLTRTAGRVSGVLTESGEQLSAGSVVLCAGAQSGRLTGYPIHPVKGQILRLRVPERLRAAGPVLTRTVRGVVRGQDVYLVPRANGEVVLGATQEQQGFDTTVTAGGVLELLRNAYELMPISSEFEMLEMRAGLRPGTPDNGPLLGEAEPGLILATGHHRNGMLLSASTGVAVAALIAGRPVAAAWVPFGPHRFEPAAQHRPEPFRPNV